MGLALAPPRGMTSSATTRGTAETLGKLCVGGDWACAHGDFGGLRQVARQLSAYLPEPLHCELEALVAACVADPDRAATMWHAVKCRVHRDARS